MATVSRENIGLLNDKLTVQVAKEDYLPSFEKSLKKYAKSANIPGFRKGMVPTSMVKKMYGSSVFVEEVLRTVETELNKYMQEERLDIFAQPLPLDSDARQLDMNNPNDYSFAFEIGLKPTIDIDLNRGHFTYNKVEVTDAMVNDQLAYQQRRHGSLLDLEAVENDDTVLSVKFTEVNAEGQPVEDGVNKEQSFLLKNFSESFRPTLIGKKAGDTVNLQLKEAFDDESFAGVVNELGMGIDTAAAAEKHFELTLKRVAKIETPAMEQEFFEKVFPGQQFGSSEEFVNKLREQIQQQWDRESSNQLHDQIYHHLLDHTTIEFPEAFLKRWMKEGGEKPKNEDEVNSEFPSFINSLKWQLISSQLIQENNVNVSQEEVKQFAKEQLLYNMGISNLSEAPWMDGYAEKMLKEDKSYFENAYYQLQTHKLFGALEAKLTPEVKVVSPDELNGMQHHHSH